MTARDPWTAAQDEFRAACDAFSALEQALPAFRRLVVAFGEPLHGFLRPDSPACDGCLSDLVQTLRVHAMRVSEGRQVISSKLAQALDSVGRYRAHLDAASGGPGDFRGLHRMIDALSRGIADIERFVTEAEHLLAIEVERILEVALRHDLPPAVSKAALELIDRSKR